MKVLAQTFALFLAITPLLAAPIHVPASDAVAETSGAHVGHYHRHHHTTHQPEERSLLGEEQLEERSFDEEEVMLERRGGALSTLKPKKEEKKKSGFEVVRKPAPQRQNSTGTARSVQVAQHGGTERTGPLRVVNQKRGNGMSSLKPKKKEEEKKKSGFEVVRKPAPQRQNSTGTARSV